MTSAIGCNASFPASNPHMVTRTPPDSIGNHRFAHAKRPAMPGVLLDGDSQQDLAGDTTACRILAVVLRLCDPSKIVYLRISMLRCNKRPHRTPLATSNDKLGKMTLARLMPLLSPCCAPQMSAENRKCQGVPWKFLLENNHLRRGLAYGDALALFRNPKRR